MSQSISSQSIAWHVAMTKPRQEQVAEFNLSRQGYQTYLPLLKMVKNSKHSSKDVKTQFEPMFPRYVFFRAQNLEQSIAPVRSSVGVAQIVRFGPEPAQISLDILNKIKQLEDQQHKAGVVELSGIQPGKKIQVNDGPFNGLEGIVSEVSEKRIKVLIGLLGREANIDFELAQLMLLH